MGGISFRQEFEMPIFYKDEQIKTRRVDFLVEEVVSIELKAIYFIRRCTSRPGHKLFKSLQSRNWNVNKFWSEIITI
jgi:GxxExxY protein